MTCTYHDINTFIRCGAEISIAIICGYVVLMAVALLFIKAIDK